MASRGSGDEWEDSPAPSAPPVLIEASLVNLRGATLNEYMDTDAQWHGELVAVWDAFNEGVAEVRATERQIEQWRRESSSGRR